MCSKAKQSNVLKPEKKVVAEQADLNPLIIGSLLLTNTYNIKIFMWQFKEEDQLVDEQRLDAYWNFTPREMAYNERSQEFFPLQKWGSHTPTLQLRSLK